MEQNNVKWLPHITPEIVADARGQVIDGYCVALEGWRRGLVLKWHTKDSEKFPEMRTWFVDKPGKLFSLSSDNKTHYFFRTRGDIVPNEAVEIGGDKDKTKNYLSKAGVKVPDGKRFSPEIEDTEIVEYVSTIGFPVVIKPYDGSYGRGVITNILSEEELKSGLLYVRNTLGYKDVIVERHVTGSDLRIYVVDNAVVGAIKRIPANVIGDGISSITTLIERKNGLRSKNPRLISCPITVNEELIDNLYKHGKTLDSIPVKDEKIFLTDKSNISIGGDPVDVLDILPNSIKETAVRALKAVPDLIHGAVDIIWDDTGDGSGVVLEINPTAQIGSLLFPMEGKGRDIPAAIIDYYFPETKMVQTDKEKIYFDFSDVLEPLLTRTATITTVSASPVGKIYGKKYIVSGSVQSIDYHRGLRKQAFERKLSGFVKNLENGDIEVVVVGLNLDKVNEYKEAIFADPERSHVRSVEELDWNEPTKVGFEVKADLKLQIEQLKEMKKQLELLQKEHKVAQKNYKKITGSFTWSLTYPFRKLADFAKFLTRLF